MTEKKQVKKRPKWDFLKLLLSAFIITFGALALVTYLFPPICSSREKAYRISCINNLKQIGLLFSQYSSNNNEFLPDKSGKKGFDQLFKYSDIEDSKIFLCPACKYKKHSKKEDCYYVYMNGFKFAGSDTKPESNIPIVFDKPGSHNDCFNVLFLDGRVKSYEIKIKDCKELIELLNIKFKYSPEKLKILRDKAKEIDRLYKL